MLTRVNTAAGGSTKSLNVPTLTTKSQAIAQPMYDDDTQSNEKLALNQT